MKYQLLLFLSVFLFCSSGFAQSVHIDWQKCLGGSDIERARAIEPTADNGYIVLGSSRSGDSDITVNQGNYDVWLVKLDDTGAIQWQKRYGGSGSDIGVSVKPTQDGGYIFIATTGSINGDVTGNHGQTDIWVVKINSVGSVEWKNCYGGLADEEAASIQPTSDGGYLFIGKAFSVGASFPGNHGSGDVWVVKIDNSGQVQWQKCIGGSGAEKAAEVKITMDGAYIISGSTYSNDGDVWGNHGDFDYWVVKMDVSGAILWQRTFGGSLADEATSIALTSDSGYVITGATFSKDGQVKGNHGIHDYWVVKINKEGNPDWFKALGGTQTDVANSVIQMTDGNYAVAGTTYSTNGDVYGSKGNYDYWLAVLNPSGVLERQLCLGGASSETGSSIRQTTDGNLIVAGEAMSIDGDVTNLRGSADIWVVKLKSVPLSVNETFSTAFVTYPEPANDVLHFTCKLSYISVYSLDGKKILEAFNSSDIHIRQLPSGMYFVKAIDENRQLLSKKFIRE